MMLYRLSHNLGFLLHKTGFILDLKLRWLPKSGTRGRGNLQLKIALFNIGCTMMSSI